MSSKSIEAFRLAMRVEGDFWNAYMAAPSTMEGATLLGSVRMTLVADQEAKDAFMQVMQFVFGKAIEQAIGVSPTWNGAEKAPEHERAGRA